MSYNKRTVLQQILDKIEPGWDILKPSSDEDGETRCFFQRTGKEVITERRKFIIQMRFLRSMVLRRLNFE